MNEIKTIIEKLQRGESLDRAESETAAEKLGDWVKIKEALKAGGRKSRGGGRKVQNDSPEAIKQREYMREYRREYRERDIDESLRKRDDKNLEEWLLKREEDKKKKAEEKAETRL